MKRSLKRGVNISLIVVVMLFLSVWLGGCGNKNSVPEETGASEPEISSEAPEADQPEADQLEADQPEADQPEAVLPDGIYTAEFHTDSSMFRVSEACGGRGVLTVENGDMVIHISLGSKKIINLYPGLAEDAQKDDAVLLMPTEDTVTYSDGMTEEVYGFDVPVPALDTEFDLALIGTKGKWYDHKVSVSDAVLSEENTQAAAEADLKDGTYSVDITFEGGSGKAEILSPVTVIVTGGRAAAVLRWNSPNYDYMLVDGEKYLPVNTEGDSVFEIPVSCFDGSMQVIGDTVAMSKPHEIEYTLTFHSETMKELKTDEE